MRLCAYAFAMALLLAVAARSQASAATGSIFAQPGRVAVGQPVLFSVRAIPTPGLPTTFMIDFGDGTVAPLATTTQSIVHRYAMAGIKIVVLKALAPGVTTVVARTIVTVVNVPMRSVPLGEILDTVCIGSPVLAGTDLTVVMHYRIVSPVADFQAVLDLSDERGHLIRRSDPFPLALGVLAQTGIQTAVIPYAIPVDAGGSYRLTVFIRAVQGGTVAIGRAMRIHVLGGPDPSPKLVNQMHLNGALVAGPHLPGQSATLNFGMTSALQWPTHSLSVTGLFDPISHKSDPVFTLASSVPGAISSPDSETTNRTTAPTAGGAPKYSDVFGRAQASLPAFLGGGETLRGIDATYDYAAATYHVAYGYTQLPTQTTGARFASILDYSRKWSQGSTLHLALTGNRDDLTTFVAAGSADPLDGRTGMLELDRTFDKYLSGVFAAGISNSRDLVSGSTALDASERVDLKYAIGKDSYELEYHNAGSDFATGTGLGAQSDRVGGALTVALGLSAISQVAFSITRDALHSAFSNQNGESVSYALTPSSGVSLALGGTQNHQVSANSDAFTRGASVTLARAIGNGSWDFSASINGLHDALQPLSDGTSRTLKLDYQFRSGANAFGFGVAGSSVSGAGANTLLGETLDYGTSFGAFGPLPNTRRFELHTSFSNTITRAVNSGTRDQAWNALLSYHLTPQVALGATWTSQQQASGFDLRLDFNI